MNIFRRGLVAWALALPIWAVLLVMSFSSRSFIQPVWAQDQLPTKPPVEAPTKPPLEPQPTKEQIQPTAVPATKESPPTEIPTKSLTSIPTKTPWPTALPTKAALPTSLPTKLPVPTNTATPSSASAGFPMSDRVTPPTSRDQTQRATGTLQPSQPEVGTPDSGTVATVTGIVFDDANDNGQRDPDEVGLSGVAVSVAPSGPPPRRVPAESGATRLADGGHGQTPAGVQMVVTDARGVYSLPAIAGATVRVIVPAGWSTRQSDNLPLERAGDFPLRARSTGTPVPPAAITPLTITQSVIDFAPLIALGLGLGAVMAIGFLRLARAITASNRALALLLVRMQRTSEKPLALEATGPLAASATDARVLALLNQAGLDAAGRSLHIERVLSVTAGDRPAITALGQDGRAAFIIYTPLDARTFQRTWRTGRESNAGEVTFEQATAYPLDRWGEALAARDATAYPLDALNSGLFVADDLAAAYAYLSTELPMSARTLPRTSRWTLFVVLLPKHDLAVRAGWRYRIGKRQ